MRFAQPLFVVLLFALCTDAVPNRKRRRFLRRRVASKTVEQPKQPRWAVLPVDGQDDNELCCLWAAEGWCDERPFWMRPHCQKSCGTPGCKIDNALMCKVAVNVAGCPFLPLSVPISSDSKKRLQPQSGYGQQGAPTAIPPVVTTPTPCPPPPYDNVPSDDCDIVEFENEQGCIELEFDCPNTAQPTFEDYSSSQPPSGQPYGFTSLAQQGIPSTAQPQYFTTPPSQQQTRITALPPPNDIYNQNPSPPQPPPPTVPLTNQQQPSGYNNGQPLPPLLFRPGMQGVQPPMGGLPSSNPFNPQPNAQPNQGYPPNQNQPTSAPYLGVLNTNQQPPFAPPNPPNPAPAPPNQQPGSSQYTTSNQFPGPFSNNNQAQYPNQQPQQTTQGVPPNRSGGGYRRKSHGTRREFRIRKQRPEECTNEHILCNFWANDGECAENAEMLVKCRKACSLC